MEQQKNEVPKINLDGVSYEVDQFSTGVQQAVLIYNRFQAQLQDQQLEVMKTQAAMQTIAGQISEAVKKELAEKDEDKVEDTPEVVEDAVAPVANGAAND